MVWSTLNLYVLSGFSAKFDPLTQIAYITVGIRHHEMLGDVVQRVVEPKLGDHWLSRRRTEAA